MTDHLEVAWYDFESEPEMTGDGSGNPETHYLTIAVVEDDGSKGEEIAVICHRLCGGKYPLDGDLANEKRRHAQIIVDALNHDHPEVPDALVGEFRYANQLARTETLVVTITQPIGSEGAAYRLTLPSGDSRIIGDAQDAYPELAGIIDDAFGMPDEPVSEEESVILCILCKTKGPAPAYGLGHIGDHIVPEVTSGSVRTSATT